MRETKGICLMRFSNNREELKKLEKTIQDILQRPDAEVRQVALTGHASPEGVYAHNEELAKMRTESLRDYLLSKREYRSLPFGTTSVAEDWNGLRKAISASSMEYRQEVLQIIGTDYVPDVKEERLRALDGGKAFGLLQRDFFPKLRRTVCEIHYMEPDYEK